MMYNVKQRYYDNRCSPESWSSLLMSLLAKKDLDCKYPYNKA